MFPPATSLGSMYPSCTHTLELMLGKARLDAPSMSLTLWLFSLLPILQKSLPVLGAWKYHLLIAYLFTAPYINTKNLVLDDLKIQPLAIQKATDFAKGFIVYFDTKVKHWWFLSSFLQLCSLPERGNVLILDLFFFGSPVLLFLSFHDFLFRTLRQATLTQTS